MVFAHAIPTPFVPLCSLPSTVVEVLPVCVDATATAAGLALDLDPACVAYQDHLLR